MILWLALGCTPRWCGETPWLELGGGEIAWEELSEGDDVTVVHGPQGGWHILASVHAYGLQDIVDVHYTVELLDDAQLVSDNELQLALTNYDDEACDGNALGIYGYITLEQVTDDPMVTPPDVLGGEDVRMRVELQDSSGAYAEVELDVVAMPDPKDL
ncbi:MAG: hypothetical protein GY913_23230 [Proteobacteria bacterium]|nr:hypothetical protein [Pseudomonadota bacterium]MCP4919825.1 hypothetical protein [Pseudomonadota bacterium]